MTRRMPSPWRKKLIDAVTGAFGGFARHGDINLSATISFFAILSIVPLLFIVVSFIGLILGHSEDLLHKTISAIENFIPDLSPQIIDSLRGVVKHSRALGWMGLIVLLWSSDLALTAVSNALNVIFESGKKRTFIISKLVSLGIIVGGGLALVVSFSLPPVLKVMAKSNVFIDFVIPYILPFITFIAVMEILPAVRMNIWNVASGAVIFSILWEGAKAAFTWYITHISKINIIYSSLGSLFMTILWIYYSAIVFLLCAEFVRSLGASKDPPVRPSPGEATDGM